MAGIAIGTVIAYRPPGCVVEVINGITYCYDNYNWYRIDGTNYIVAVHP